jgi:hypothetical protein
MSRRAVRGVAGWVFGLSVTVFLIATWGRAVIVDTDVLAEAAAPLSGSVQVVDIVAGWLREEMVDAGIPGPVAEEAVGEVMESPTVSAALNRIVTDVVLAAGSPGRGEAVVDVAEALRPAVPEITRTLSAVAGPIDEATVRRVVDSMDPLVVVADGERRSIGPGSPVAGRLGVASILALATMLVTGWTTVGTGDDRMLELRQLLTRVALGALSFAVMLRIGSWVLSPQAGRAPVSEALSVIARSKWTVPLIIGLGSGAAALVVREIKLARRRRVAVAAPGSPGGSPVALAQEAAAEAEISEVR